MVGNTLVASSSAGLASWSTFVSSLISGLDIGTLVSYLPNVTVALLLGLVIGFERRSRHKQAGVRTHMVLSVTSCLITFAGYHLFKETGMGDPARLAHGVVNGVGFVGAGVILRRGLNASGITTAATILFSVIIGIACGLGLFGLAVLTVALTLLCLSFSYWFFPSYDYGGNVLRVVCPKDKFDKVRKLFGTNSRIDRVLKRGEVLEVQIHTNLSHTEVDKLIATQVHNDDIIAVELIDQPGD